MAHQGLDDSPLQRALSELLLTMAPELQYTAPHLLLKMPKHETIDSLSTTQRTDRTAAGDIVNKEVLVNKPKLIKVGFVSTNFYDHSIGKILVQLMLMLDNAVLPECDAGAGNSFSDGFDDFSNANAGSLRRGACVFEVRVFLMDRRLPLPLEDDSESGGSSDRGGNDPSATSHNHAHDHDHDHDPTLIHDTITRILGAKLLRRFVRVPLDVDHARRVIGAAQLDFLLFADVGMDFFTYELAFSRLAPLQVG
jgi:hypothetical protein